MSDIFTVCKRQILKIRIYSLVFCIASLLAFGALTLLSGYAKHINNETMAITCFSFTIVFLINAFISISITIFSFISNSHQYMVLGQTLTVYSGLITCKCYLDEDLISTKMHGWDLAKPLLMDIKLKNDDIVHVRVNKSGRVIIKFKNETIKPIDGKNKGISY